MYRLALLLSFRNQRRPAFGTGAGGNAARPNVVLIITDDVGYGDFGSYGAPDIKTPNIDSLARDGVRLTDFYANGATCSPTRAGLISGRYQQRFAIEAAAWRRAPQGRERGLPADRAVAAAAAEEQRLRDRAHRQVAPGIQARSSVRAPTGSTTSSASRAASSTTTSTPPANGAARPVRERPAGGGRRLHDGSHHRAVRPVHRAERAAAVLHRCRVQRRALAVPAARQAVQGASTTRRHLGPFDDPHEHARRTTSRCSSAPIRASARSSQALDRLGLRQNTIVIFTNDNGGEWLSRNTPLFHHKGTVWEGGIRVPAIFRWPGHIPAGSVSARWGSRWT